MVNYSNVLTETSEILNYFDKSILEKIPQKLIDKIQEKQTVTTEEILGGFELC